MDRALSLYGRHQFLSVSHPIYPGIHPALFIIAEFGGSDVQAGLAMTSFQIGTSLFRPFAGYLIDKKNKRQLLLLALVLFNLVMLAFNFWQGWKKFSCSGPSMGYCFP